jgi:hypothetical protein
MRHTISRDDLIAHLEQERWERYASSSISTSHEAKILQFSNRRQFRVMVGKRIVYDGQSPTDAVNAYNEA